MFRSAAITGFIAVIAGIILHFAVSKPKFDDVFGKDRGLRILDPLRLVVFFITLLFVEQKWSLVGVLRKLVFLLAILCFVVLVVTGFTPMIFLGKLITSWWLMIHATVAPIFAVCIAALAVLWAEKNRLDKNYWPWLNRALLRQPKSTTPPEKYELELKISFWAILIIIPADDSLRHFGDIPDVRHILAGSSSAGAPLQYVILVIICDYISVSCGTD